DTAIGRCGIAWGERGIAAVQLPEATEARTRARLLRRCPAAREASPPAAVRGAIEGIVALLRGERADLSGVAVDLQRVAPVDRQAYAGARSIAAGMTSPYGEIAARRGDRRRARDVGQSLGRNPCPLIVPCHRVLAAGGSIGGFSANGGIATKLRLLAIERAR